MNVNESIRAGEPPQPTSRQRSLAATLGLWAALLLVLFVLALFSTNRFFGLPWLLVALPGVALFRYLWGKI